MLLKDTPHNWTSLKRKYWEEKKEDDDKTDKGLALSPENKACGPDQNAAPNSIKIKTGERRTISLY